MLTTTLAGLWLIGLQATPLPSNDDFAEDMRQRPPRTDASQPLDPAAEWLTQCLDQLEQDASRAHTQAQIRRAETTGPARVLANHCLGLAATELELWSDAQTAFTAARDETPEDELRTRARFGTMAGNAAFQTGEPNAALNLLVQAEKDAEAASEGSLTALTAIDRARVLVAIEQAELALEALTKATQLLPGSSEAWLLKATLLRRMGQLEDAQSAIEQAVATAQLDPQVGLEAGVIAVLDGRDQAARSSWQSVIDTSPESPEARTAQDYLAQLGPAPEPSDALEQ